MNDARKNLLDADARRQTIVDVALLAFAETGFSSTPVTAIAKQAGISQSYVFKLFPTKEELFIAALERCYQNIQNTLESAAQSAHSDDPGVLLSSMGKSYAGLITPRSTLMLQVHAQSAAHTPAIRRAVQLGLQGLVDFIKNRTGASNAAVQSFMAFGQLCHVIAAAQISEVDGEWARTMAQNIPHMMPPSGSGEAPLEVSDESLRA